MGIFHVLKLLLFVMYLRDVFGRGPHHPRGEGISQHHVHYRPTKGPHSEKLTQDSQLLHDKEHIQEDLGEFMQEKDLAAMTEEELEFHYFQVHDFDNNSHLDGLEILQALHHTVNHDEVTGEEIVTTEADFQYYVELIDKVLAEDDRDFDGLLSYPEYVASKKNNEPKTVQNEVSVTQTDN